MIDVIEPDGMIPMTEEQLEESLAKVTACKLDRSQVDYAHFNGICWVVMMKPDNSFKEDEFLDALSSPFPGYRAIHKKRSEE